MGRGSVQYLRTFKSIKFELTTIGYFTFHRYMIFRKIYDEQMHFDEVLSKSNDEFFRSN